MAKKHLKPNRISDKSIEQLKNNFDFGNGVDFSMATTDSAGKTTFDSHYTNKLPKLEINIANNKRIIEVETSCVEEDDKKLLYYLYKKTIEE